MVGVPREALKGRSNVVEHYLFSMSRNRTTICFFICDALEGFGEFETSVNFFLTGGAGICNRCGLHVLFALLLPFSFWLGMESRKRRHSVECSLPSGTDAFTVGAIAALHNEGYSLPCSTLPKPCDGISAPLAHRLAQVAL